MQTTDPLRWTNKLTNKQNLTIGLKNTRRNIQTHKQIHRTKRAETIKRNIEQMKKHTEEKTKHKTNKQTRKQTNKQTTNKLKHKSHTHKGKNTSWILVPPAPLEGQVPQGLLRRGKSKW